MPGLPLRPIAMVSFLVGSVCSAGAMVGDAPVVQAPFLVTIVGSRGNFCTGALLAPDLVLTAAHCLGGQATYKIVDGDPRAPRLIDVRRSAVHPGFEPAAMQAHRATADVGLLQLAKPLKGRARLAIAPADRVVTAGSPLTVTGIGVTLPGDGRSGGKPRAAQLVATGQPGTLQIRLVDPNAQGKSGRGACTGDSGAPATQEQDGSAVIVGVVSWSTGPDLVAGCGGLTGVTPLVRYRDWIVTTARNWGVALGAAAPR